MRGRQLSGGDRPPCGILGRPHLGLNAGDAVKQSALVTSLRRTGASGRAGKALLGGGGSLSQGRALACASPSLCRRNLL